MRNREQLFRESISPDDDVARKLYACARAAHEVNLAYSIALGETAVVAWEDVDEAMFASIIDGIKGVLKGNGPTDSHKSWLAFKEKEGWKYGPAKDFGKKEHPCMVPYQQLPPAQRAKDHLFVSTVLAMAKALGLPAA